MKRLIGFIFFWISIGMIIMLFISKGFLALFMIALCLFLGYLLFFC